MLPVPVLSLGECDQWLDIGNPRPWIAGQSPNIAGSIWQLGRGPQQAESGLACPLWNHPWPNMAFPEGAGGDVTMSLSMSYM